MYGVLCDDEAFKIGKSKFLILMFENVEQSRKSVYKDNIIFQDLKVEFILYAYLMGLGKEPLSDKGTLTKGEYKF